MLIGSTTAMNPTVTVFMMQIDNNAALQYLHGRATAICIFWCFWVESEHIGGGNGNLYKWLLKLIYYCQLTTAAQASVI